jgi:transcriptional regulator with XRE-family HTH domain
MLCNFIFEIDAQRQSMSIKKSLAGEFEPFAKRLLRLKLARGLSSADLARAVEVTPTAVWNWENGNTEPRHLTMIKLADALHVSPDVLEFGDKPSPKRIDAEEKPQSVGQIAEQAQRAIAAAIGVEPRSVRLLVQLSV